MPDKNTSNKSNPELYSSLKNITNAEFSFEAHKYLCDRVEEFELRTWTCAKGQIKPVGEDYRGSESSIFESDTKMSIRMYDNQIGLKISPKEYERNFYFKEHDSKLIHLHLYEVAASEGELIGRSELYYYRSAGAVMIFVSINEKNDEVPGQKYAGHVSYFMEGEPMIEDRESISRGKYKVYMPNIWRESEKKHQDERTHTFPRIVLTSDYMNLFLEKLSIQIFNPKYQRMDSSGGIGKGCDAYFCITNEKFLNKIKEIQEAKSR